MTHDSIILGIDPGYGRLGIAIIKKTKGTEILIHSECFETKTNIPHPHRLLLIANKVKDIIKEFSPDQLAIENLLFGRNQKTALKVAEARGVILSEAARANIALSEHNPKQIKLAVTGYGKSDKLQVIDMLHKIFKMKSKKKFDDEYDAIAVALTAAATPLSTIRDI